MPELDCLRKIKFKLSWRYSTEATQVEDGAHEADQTTMTANDRDRLDHVGNMSTNLESPLEIVTREDREESEVVASSKSEICNSDSGELYTGGNEDDEVCASADGETETSGAMATVFDGMDTDEDDHTESNICSPFSPFMSSPMDQSAFSPPTLSPQPHYHAQPHSPRSPILAIDQTSSDSARSDQEVRWSSAFGGSPVKCPVVEVLDDPDVEVLNIKTELIDEGFVDSNNNGEFVMDLNIHH